MSAAVAIPDPPARTPWRLVLLLGALTAFGPLAIDMYLPALPSLQASIGASPAQAQTSMSTFFAGMAIGQFIYGPASDRLGRRGPLLAGIVLFVVASIACALAVNPTMLIAARFAQALGGCAGQVIARAVVRDRFGHQDTARILSFLTLIMGLAPILAPTLGSLILQVASWRVIFWFMVAFSAAIGLWMMFDLQESRSQETADHARSEHVFRTLGALLTHRRLIGYALAGGLNGAMVFTYISVSADLLMGTYGFAPVPFAMMFSLNAVAIIAGSQVNRSLLRRWPSDYILSRASLMALAGAVVLVLFAFTGWGGAWTVLPTVFFIMASYGFMPGNTMAGALSVDPRRAGSISALMGTASFGAGAIVSTVTGLFHDSTARPLATTVLIVLAGSSASLFLLTFRPMASDPRP